MSWDKLGGALANIQSDIQGNIKRQRGMRPNPHKNPKVRSGGFFSSDVARLLSGWETSSDSIDYYLQTELRQLRARSRKMVRANPYGKRFIAMIKSNVVGPNGVTVQAQTTRGKSGDLDTPANNAIEGAFREWGQKHCDYHGKSTWQDMQNLAIACAAQDGEFLFQKMYTGPHGYQLKAIDAELLDVNRNATTKNGEIRLGVEYDKNGKVIRYHFRKNTRRGSSLGGSYQTGDEYTVEAKDIIHGFISEWPDQSRGAPWMHASLERSKHLEKYDEAAIVKARSTAATMAVLQSTPGEAPYEGEEESDDGTTLDQYEAGTIKDIGDRSIVNLDSDYPHQMYAAFVKSQLQGIASGLGISYHALANDLEGVNYSSIRAGVLEDREVFKGLQNWFVRCFIRPVFEDWLLFAYVKSVIKIGRFPLSRPPLDYMAAHYQGRRWAWVDPAKDGAANKLAIDERLKSRSQIMREQGDDPETVWLEIKRDEDKMLSLGIQPILKDQPLPEDPDNE